jgi:actin-like ATPase involved in cell morphogenesis
MILEATPKNEGFCEVIGADIVVSLPDELRLNAKLIADEIDTFVNMLLEKMN